MKIKTTSIKVCSRASVKIKENFYTVEFGEERSVENASEKELQQAREDLWNTCNTEVDNQIREIVDTFAK